MWQQAISDRPRTSALTATPALREALRAFSLSRVLVWGSAVLAVYVLPIRRFQEHAHDLPALTGSLGRALGALARWDAVWYLSIAQSGYGGGSSLTAFFPLYPVTVRAAAGETRSAGWRGARARGAGSGLRRSAPWRSAVVWHSAACRRSGGSTWSATGATSSRVQAAARGTRWWLA